MKKSVQISVSVNHADCGDSCRDDWTPEKLEAIGRTFLRAAVLMRERRHGAIECGNGLASIGIEAGGPFDDETGLPVIERIRVARHQPRKRAK